MTPPRPRRWKLKPRANRIDLVDEPANQLAFVHLVKRAEPVTPPEPAPVPEAAGEQGAAAELARVHATIRSLGEPDPGPVLSPAEKAKRARVVAFAREKLRKQMEQEVAADCEKLDLLDGHLNRVAALCAKAGGVTLAEPRFKGYTQDGESVAVEIEDRTGRNCVVSWKAADLTRDWARVLASVSVALDAAAPLAKRVAELGGRP